MVSIISFDPYQTTALLFFYLAHQSQLSFKKWKAPLDKIRKKYIDSEIYPNSQNFLCIPTGYYTDRHFFIPKKNSKSK